MSQDLVAKALDALKRKDFEAAIAAISRHAETHKLELQHYLIKGLSEITLSQWQAAEETFLKATHHFPYQAQLWLNLGLAQENNSKLDEAIISFEHCLDLDPKQADACGNLSNIYRKKGLFHEAEAMARCAYEGGAFKAQALNSLGLALGKQGKYAEAEKVLQQALVLEPHNALFLSNLANLNVDQLNFMEAWKFFSAARSAHDVAVIRRDEGMARLLTADYAAGWTLYEARLELHNALRCHPPCPRYAGENLAGKKLLLLAEQGFGDTIMFCRYGEWFAKQGAELIWAVQKPIQNLLNGQVPGFVYAEADNLPKADYYLPLLSIPFAAHKFQPIEAPPSPYLKACTQTYPSSLSPHDTQLRQIGLVWSGSRTHERDHERSLGLRHLEPVLRNVAGNYYALSKEVEASELLSTMPIKNLAPYIHDFSDTANFIQHMDIVVSVDTSVAHLAGAMGIKTYILLPYCPDWRWGLGQESTPWYPNVTLLRQDSYGNWDRVITKLLLKLQTEP